VTITANHRIAIVAGVVYALDQATKFVVSRYLDLAHQVVVVDGFFKLVHWANTGAAWSMFPGNNVLLAVISVLALLVLWFSKDHFEADRTLGQVALGLILGGILGNLTDRLVIGHVTDFLYFHLYRRGGGELGFPAFNMADSAICTGVGLLFLLSWRSERHAVSAPKGTASEA